MSIMGTNHLPVKPTRRTPRPDAPFGAGLIRFVPSPVLAPGFVEPSAEDRAWAPLALNVGPAMEPDYDALAYDDFCRAMTPVPTAGLCVACGTYADELAWKLCPDCFERAAEDASVASANLAAGLGFRVF